ncbi:MAG TPA: YdcF family protein [Syntrophorhabdaceae bacterium]|nr:YdcF family protein [Syntrophorhabdaceae bacterium]
MTGFVLKKILTIILLPVGLIVVILIVAALFMKKRLKICVIALAVLIYMLSIDPTADLFIVPLEDAQRPASLEEVKTGDVYVVLGGGINENAPDINGVGMIGSSALARIITAYRLYLIAKKPIIFSGGMVFTKTPEAEVARRFLVSLGVASQDIIMEGKSMDTYENARYVREIADKYQFRKIVLITSAYHMKRSYMLFSRRFTQILPFPTDFKTSRGPYDPLSFLPSAENLALVETAMREYMGILFYTVNP